MRKSSFADWPACSTASPTWSSRSRSWSARPGSSGANFPRRSGKGLVALLLIGIVTVTSSFHHDRLRALQKTYSSASLTRPTKTARSRDRQARYHADLARYSTVERVVWRLYLYFSQRQFPSSSASTRSRSGLLEVIQRAPSSPQRSTGEAGRPDAHGRSWFGLARWCSAWPCSSGLGRPGVITCVQTRRAQCTVLRLHAARAARRVATRLYGAATVAGGSRLKPLNMRQRASRAC